MKEAPSYESQELREFARTLRGRRTIDQYIQMPVPDELVREAIEVATWAPNHFVTEPWQFILPGPETVERIVDLCAENVAIEKGEFDQAENHARQAFTAIDRNRHLNWDAINPLVAELRKALDG